MSYLGRLMEQTGLDFAVAAISVAPVPAPAEVEEVREAQPAAVAREEHHAHVPAAIDMPASSSTAARATAVDAPGSAAREGPSLAAALPAAPAKDEPPTMKMPAPFQGPEAREPSRQEIVIEERVIERTLPVPELPGIAMAPPPAVLVKDERPAAKAPAHVALPASFPRPEAAEPTHPEIIIEERVIERAPDAAPAKSAAEPRAQRPVTLVEVRNWVAATPAPGEACNAPAAPDPRLVTDAEPAPLRAEARPASSTGREGVGEHAAPTVQHVDLSIGTVEVTVELPAAAPTPVALPTAVAQAQAAPPRSRLARRYLRI